MLIVPKCKIAEHAENNAELQKNRGAVGSQKKKYYFLFFMLIKVKLIFRRHAHLN